MLAVRVLRYQKLNYIGGKDNMIKEYLLFCESFNLKASDANNLKAFCELVEYGLIKEEK